MSNTLISDRKTFINALFVGVASTTNLVETRTGNISLRRYLDWGVLRYARVRDSLLRDGIITSGRGHGGTVVATASKRSLLRAIAA